MTRAFFLVTLLSFKNRILSRVKRLRQPRYLISTMLGMAYFWMMFLRRMSFPRRPVPFAAAFSEFSLDIISVVALVIMIAAWALPGDTGGLEFTEAEIQFLFPAPLQRRQILLYKFLRAQPQILISSIIATFLSRSRGLFIGGWMAFSVLTIYFMFTALGRARLRLAGIGFWWRLLGVFITLVGLAAFCWFQFRAGGVLESLAGFKDVENRLFSTLDKPFHSWPMLIIFFLPRMLAQAAYPPTLAHLGIACAVLAVVGTLLLIAAGRMNVAFEEASIIVSAIRAQRRAARLQRMSGKRTTIRRGRPLFELRESGRPEVAIVWKNINSMMRRESARLVLIILTIIIAGNVIIRMRWPETLQVSGMITLAIAGAFGFFGAFVFRNDLRLDLPKIEILKSYPLSGESLVAAEMAAPLILISFFEIVLVGAGLLQMHLGAGPHSKLAFFSTLEFAIIALMFIIPLAAIQLVIQNAAVVLFPAWAVPSREEARGFAASGQRLLTMIAHLLTLGVALIPSALILGPAIWAAHTFFAGSPLLIAVGTVPSVAILVAEVWFAVRFLGARFDQLDVSNDVDPAG